jgi:hypothetical protein
VDHRRDAALLIMSRLTEALTSDEWWWLEAAA